MAVTDVIKHLLQDLGVATALLTRLPVPPLPDAAFARQAHSAWAWPLVGVLIGGIAVVPGLVALGLGLPASIAALLVLAGQMILTGAMHEDGLADSADGLWGGWTRDRRLEIMKDSQIGTYGVLALIICVGLRWSVLSQLLLLGGWPVIAVAVLSRAAMPVLMTALPNARGGGLAHGVGAPSIPAAAMAPCLALCIGLGLTGPAAIPAALAVALSAALLGWIALRKIGGQTGDILGASQQIGEIAAGLTLLAAG